MFGNLDFAELIIRVPVILLALSFHEFAHAWAAFKRGDDTAAQMGRLTLNPLAHLDILGTIMLLFGPFGWAKPVPVNFHRLKDPRRDGMLVAAAGPAMNLLLATISGYALKLYLMSGGVGGAGLSDGVIQFLFLAIILNLGLAFFNLLPLYPLDGSRVVAGLIPPEAEESYAKFSRYGPFIFLAVIILPPLNSILWTFLIGASSIYLKLVGLGSLARLFFR